MTPTNRTELNDLERNVACFIDRERLLPQGARVAMAVSGGGDSVALLHILLALTQAGAGYRLSVAHLNHQLRPGDAERDEAFVRDLARRLSLPYVGAARDVRADARDRRLNLEAAARAARYEFLEEAARTLGADHVATGHTRDDQLETVLWRLRRSDDLHALAGILTSRPVREGSPVTLVRPLLDVGRQQLREYLTARSISWLTDHTNRDLRRTRNLIRLRDMPEVRARLGEGYLEDLLRLARRVAQLNRQSRELTETLLNSTAHRTERAMRLPLDWLRQLPAEFRSSLLYRALRHVELALAPPGRFLDSALTRGHVQAVFDAVDVDHPLLIDQLPGELIVRQTDGELFIGPRSAEASPLQVPPRPLPEADGTVEVPELGLRVTVRSVEPSDVDWRDWLGRRESTEDMLDAEAAGPRSELVLRTRRPGDRFRLLGAPGGKKLKDFFIDRKVPRPKRDRTLVLCRATEVLWVAGLGVSDQVKVCPETRHLLHLRLDT